MVKKTNTVKKSDLKYWFLSTIKLILWWNTYEANKVFYIDEKIALELKSSIFYKKWSIKEVKNEAN